MDAELQKVVEAGKLTAAGAEQLEQLKPGAFCLHKSWGFGQVAGWNLLLNQIVIDFKKKKAHPMQLQYAADNLTPIPAHHFLALKANDLPALKNQLKENPTAMMRNILESLGGKATQAQISSWLLGDVFSEPEFKRWWDSTKKLLKKEGHSRVPAKRNEPIELRSAPVSRADELLSFFNQARQPKEQAAALDQIELEQLHRNPESTQPPAHQVQLWRVRMDRIRGHIQLCWLALLLIRVVENATGDTWRNTRHELDRMHLVTLATNAGQVAQRSATTPGQQTILRALDLPEPPKFFNFTLPDSR